MREIRTLKQLETALNELKAEILSRPLFLNNGDEAKAERKSRCVDRVWEFARVYFPDYVPAEGAGFHGKWEKVQLIENEPVLLMAFRGSGKSTYFSLLDPIHAIAYGLRNFMIFSSYNEEKIAVFSGRILLELLYNQRLIHDFGIFIPQGRSAGVKNFTADVPGTGRTVQVRSISIGQDPRGFVHGPHRPDYVRMDDIQSRKRSRSQKFVRESVEWIMQDLIPALAEGYSAVIVATPLNTQCVASTLEKGTDEINAVKSFKYPAEERSKPTWKDHFPASRLAKLKRTIGSTAYAQEYLLIPVALDERIFKEESIKSYDPALVKNGAVTFSYIFSWTDPSVKHEEKHCFKATICAGITSEGMIYVLKDRVRKESVSRMVEGMYQIYEQCNPQRMFFEDNGGQALLTEIFPDQKELIDQLLQFPGGEFKDAPDALEGAVRKLQEYERKRRAGLPQTSRPREALWVLEGY